jgi:hypothetical protein
VNIPGFPTNPGISSTPTFTIGSSFKMSSTPCATFPFLQHISSNFVLSFQTTTKKQQKRNSNSPSEPKHERPQTPRRTLSHNVLAHLSQLRAQRRYGRVRVWTRGVLCQPGLGQKLTKVRVCAYGTCEWAVWKW